MHAWCSIMKKGFWYLETDASGVGLEAGLQQVRDGMSWLKVTASGNIKLQPKSFAIKSLSSAKTHYSSLEKETLDIWHGLEKFY